MDEYCESEVSDNSFASEPANPLVPCFDFKSVLVLDNDTLADVFRYDNRTAIMSH